MNNKYIPPFGQATIVLLAFTFGCFLCQQCAASGDGDSKISGQQSAATHQMEENDGDFYILYLSSFLFYLFLKIAKK
jgi:hypothetical protein